MILANLNPQPKRKPSLNPIFTVSSPNNTARYFSKGLTGISAQLTPYVRSWLRNIEYFAYSKQPYSVSLKYEPVNDIIGKKNLATEKQGC